MASFDISLIHDDAVVAHTAAQITQSSFSVPTSFCSDGIIYTGKCVVHRGSLLCEGIKDPLDAVCKVALGDLSRIRHEAQLYVSHDHLYELQGDVVPRFYGYYECKHNVGELEVDMGCMVLEYCGKRVPRKLLGKKETKVAILSALLIIHHVALLTHGDFADDSWRHVLLRETENGRDYRIIDFDHARKHECEQSIPVDFEGYEPSLAKFGCMELYDIVQNLDIWTPAIIDFFNYPYCIFQVGSVERLVACAMARPNSVNYSEAEIREEAEKLLGEYFALYGDRFKYIGHPLQFKRKLNLPNVEEPEDEVIPVCLPPDWQPLDVV